MSPRRALVLAGGGARGAYGAGVVRYLRGEFARDLGRQPRLDLLAGTSIGAINACFVGSTAHALDTQGEALADVWRSLRLEEVFHWSALDPWGFARRAWSFYKDLRSPGSLLRLSDFVQPDALRRLVEQRIDWGRLHENVRQGLVQALTVIATDLGTGKAVVFVESREGPPAFPDDPNVEVRARQLGPEHALASGALPLLFRPVPIEGSWFSDGFLKQNVPLLPVLRLGAERILVVVQRDPPRPHPAPRLDPGSPPTTAAQVGRVLSALMLDGTDRELARMHGVNALLDEGERTFGAGFAARLAALAEQGLGYPLARVQELVVRPSQDLGDIARAHAQRRLRAMRPGTLAARLLRRAAEEAEGQDDGSADLASYLLFDRDYAEDLIALGTADARARREALAAFFDDAGAAGEAPAAAGTATAGAGQARSA
ncbi:MAG: patatin-like phospholipase family protein [Anaeromyxobacter sp.]